MSDADTQMTSTDVEPLPAIGPGSRVRFVDISVVQDGTDYLVGTPHLRDFFAMPEVGVMMIEALQHGLTVGEATDLVSEILDAPVDIASAVEDFIEIGLVTHVDGFEFALPSGAMREGRMHRLITPERARRILSRPFWIASAMALLGSLAILVLQPRLRPAAEHMFVAGDVVVMLAAYALYTVLAIALHEGMHWVGARAAGVPARIDLSRRWVWVVFHTDLTNLYTVPRRERFPALIAGMAFDVLVLFGALAARLAWSNGSLELDPSFARFLGGVVVISTAQLSFQFLVYMKTDVYAVLTTALGTRDLYNVGMLWLRKATIGLTNDEAAMLDNAHPNDLRALRWYRALTLLGITLLAWLTVTVFLPVTLPIIWWVLGSIASAPLGSWAWLGAVGVATAWAWQLLLLIFVLWRERAWARAMSRDRLIPSPRRAVIAGSATAAVLVCMAVALWPGNPPGWPTSSTVAAGRAACHAAPGKATDVQDYALVSYWGAAHDPYLSAPPTSGAALPWGAAPGTYSSPLSEEVQVASLARGLILVQYPETDDRGTPRFILDAVRQRPDVLVAAPLSDSRTEGIATAWGRHLALDEARSRTITRFVDDVEAARRTCGDA